MVSERQVVYEVTLSVDADIFEELKSKFAYLGGLAKTYPSFQNGFLNTCLI